MSGCTGSNRSPPATRSSSDRLSTARCEPASAPEDSGTLSPVGETASTVAASSVSVVVEVVYTVASIGPATTSGD